MAYVTEGYAIKIIPSFMTYIMPNNEIPVKKKPHACIHHPLMAFNCKVCNNLTMHWSYLYPCDKCKQLFCLPHFISHALLFGYCIHEGIDIDCMSDLIEITEQASMVIPLSIYHQIALNLEGSKITISHHDPTKRSYSIYKQFVDSNIRCLGNTFT